MKATRFNFYYLFFFLCAVPVISQEKNTPKNIYSVEIKVNNKKKSYPVVDLNGFINLSFDDLDAENKDYYYQINHYDYKWKKSKLFKVDYIDGFDDNLITNTNNSFNTLVDYNHYKITIPNEDLKLKISGNFSISIHDEDGDFLFERKFSVVNKKVSLSSFIKKSTELKNYETHHEIDVIVKCNSCSDLIGNSSDLKLVLIKNNNWRESKIIEKPDFKFIDRLIYKNISSAAGNEYRYFDNSKINLTNLKVYKTQLNDIYNSFLTTDYDRNKISYEYNPDINGLFFISQNIENPNLQNDYSKVHFNFKPHDLNQIKKVYIVGEFNNYELSEKHELKLTNNSYQGEFLFKQGFYNYKYCSVNSNNELKYYSGDYWETENSYTVLLFYKRVNDKYYSLIGNHENSSKNIIK